MIWPICSLIVSISLLSLNSIVTGGVPNVHVFEFTTPECAVPLPRSPANPLVRAGPTCGRDVAYPPSSIDRRPPRHLARPMAQPRQSVAADRGPLKAAPRQRFAGLG